MKTYHGVRLSQVLGDVEVTIRQLWGTCSECKTLVPAGPDHKFEHFNEKFNMCSAQIQDTHITETPLMKRNTIEPTDFEWGPKQRLGAQNLAAAILWDILSDTPSTYLVKSFAVTTTMVLGSEEWYLSEQQVTSWVHSQDRRFELV